MQHSIFNQPESRLALLASEALEFSTKHNGAEIRISEAQSSLLVMLSGSIDYPLSGDLQDLLSHIVTSCAGWKRIRINLKGVSYISSTGVGALTNALLDSWKQKVDIVFCDLPPKISFIIDVLGLKSFFPLESSCD